MIFPDTQTKMIGILGHPVDHSLSPTIHNAALQHQGLNFVYVAMDVSPENLSKAVQGLSILGFAGANVTIPHKRSVRSHLDHLTEAAQMIGAVNTIVCNGGELLGDNTDMEGFLAPLRDLELRGKPMALLGAGGAARAAAYGLLREYNPQPLTIVARRTHQAERLLRDFGTFGDQIEISDFESASNQIRESQLVVNTTPVGMYPNVEETPWRQKEYFSAGQIVYDLIYRPAKTRLLQEAERSGAAVIGGLAMLIEQAAASYRQWTGQEMSIGVVRDVLSQLFED